MTDVVTAIALVWSGLLLVAGGVRLLRDRDVVSATIALSWLGTLLVILLAVISFRSESPYYLDAALAVGLLSFVGTLATLRYHRRGTTFR